MKLLIVESPTKIKTISKYLGKDSEIEIKASVGHVRDLPKSNKDAIDIAGGFIPHYEISKDKKSVVADLKKEAKKAETILLATDPDREGEAIAWHVAELLKEAGVSESKIKRVVWNEITENAVKEALKHPREIDQNLRKAQEARRVLDRLVGYDLSGIVWKKVRYGLSAGRVQSPALKILVEREKEIRAFKPEKYWVISADFLTEKEERLTLTCKEEPRDENLVKKIVEIAKTENWKVKEVKESEQKRSPYAPFITSTLQQTASSRLGFSPSKTMQTAQKLYEAGLITYMRTDSTNLSQEALGIIEKTIKKEFGENYYQFRVFKKKSKNAQEAHEAIRPSNPAVKIGGQNSDQQKLYDLIYKRTLASQMIDAKLKKTRIVGNVESEQIPDFTITGSRLIESGWYKVDPQARGEDLEVPKVAVGEKLDLQEIKTQEKETLPPPRYSEAGLVKELEKLGVGRPSTYASIIKTIQDRGYVVKENKALKPTDTGEVVSDFLSAHFDKYVGYTFTAEMEDKLDEIASGDRDYEKTLRDFYTPFSADVKSKEKLEKATDLGKADPEMKCPKCESEMIIKLSKAGKFLSCIKFPECQGARTIEGKELEGPKETGEKCPQCKDGKLIEREGKFGKFISCSNYPKCKFIKEDPKEAEKKKTGVSCPVCQKGEMVERRGRFGIFYSCSDYPTCKNAIKTKPTGNVCDYFREDLGRKCGALMMEGTKTIPERCSDKTCPNHRPDKLEK